MRVEWHSYEMPSYGFPEYEERKKYGIIGGLGVVSDEVLSRISGEVEILGIGVRHLRGRDLPIYEEIDGYRVIRPYFHLPPSEVISRCREVFTQAGLEFNTVHANEIPHLPFLSEYTFSIPEITTGQGSDLICSHDWMAIPGSYRKARRDKVPLVVFLHSLEAGRQGGIVHTLTGPKESRHGGYYAGSRTIRDIEAIGIKEADVCFTVGTNMVEEVKSVGKMHGVPVEEIERKTFPIHHGVDTEVYRPMKGIGKEYDLIFIGRFSPVKGIMELIDATKILLAKHPDLRVLLIGGGELERDIEERVKREGLEGNISITTRWVPPEEKAELINQAMIAVAPSKYEPHGQYDLEAGACGIPCINGTGGFMERMIHDVTAVQCNPFDPQDIAAKIDSLLRRPERIEEIGRNAREFVVHYYDWNVRARLYPPLFEAILSGDLRSLQELPLTVALDENEFQGA
jgi:glycosyltransferase involved in cell wall biosynthesis